MAFNPTSPITGGPITGFTSPTYTIAVDTPPDVNAKQFYVSALGGTQTGVTVHSVSSPFTIASWRPKVFQQLGKANPITGLISRIGRNVYTTNTRKGVLPLAGQPVTTAGLTTKSEIPAGADLADPANIKAMYSAHIGALWQQCAGLCDTSLSGTV